MSVSGKSAWLGLACGTAMAASFEGVPICATAQSSMLSICPSFARKQYFSVRGSLPASRVFQRHLHCARQKHEVAVEWRLPGHFLPGHGL